MAGPLLAEVPTSCEQNEEMLEPSTPLPLAGAAHSPLSLPAPHGEAAKPWHNLAQSGSGTVLFGPLTRMFTYTSQVILSPSVVFWGSENKMWDTPPVL